MNTILDPLTQTDNAAELVSGLPSREVFSRARAARKALGEANRALFFWMTEIGERSLFRELGYSSLFAYAESELELDPHTISEMLRTARCLSGLPRLAEVASRIAPSKLREISRVCTPETEGFWIEMAQKKTYREIEKLVAITAKGGLPPFAGSAAGVSKENVPDLPVHSLKTCSGGALLLPLMGTPREELPSGLPDAASDPVELPNPVAPAPSSSLSGTQECPIKLHYKFIADLEADTWALVEQALTLAAKRCGKRDRAEALRHLAECFLNKVEAGKQESGVPSSPYRVVIHEAAPSGVAWVEGPRGVHRVSESTVEEAYCCGEILDLRPSGSRDVTASLAEPGDRREAKELGPRLKQAIPPSVRRLVFERDGGRCQMPSCTHRAWNHIHHIVPRTEPGSSHRPGNLLLICSAYVTSELCDLPLLCA